MSRPRLLVALALTLLLAACGGTAATPTPVPATPPSTVAPSVDASPEVEPDETHASLEPVASAVATTVEVTIADYSFTPSAITVPAGEVTFALNNTAGQQHEFEIFKGDAVVDEAEGLVPGLTRDLLVTLPAGEYTFACKLADHEARGMKGTITVTG
jgi:iron uptake system component EfeO